MFLIIIRDYIGFPWINLLNFVRYTNSSICCIPSEPPIQFGQSHSHYTRTSSSFARIVCYKLNSGGSLYHLFANLPFNTFVNDISNIVTPLVLDFVVFTICMLCCNFYVYVIMCMLYCIVLYL